MKSTAQTVLDSVPPDMGRSLARWFEWDIDKVYQMAYAALIEANAHDLAAALKEAYDTFLEQEQRELEDEAWATGQLAGFGD